MDIVDRIKEFIADKGLALSQFADTCTIPRPTLSQLMSGRNSKVSDVIITKIHVAYPELSISWLMFGEGDMYVPIIASENENLSATGGSESENATLDDLDFGSDTLFGQPNAYKSTEKPVPQSQVPSPQERVQKIVNEMRSAQVGQIPESQYKKVTNIIVFYSDNSFESFGPVSQK